MTNQFMNQWNEYNNYYMNKNELWINENKRKKVKHNTNVWLLSWSKTHSLYLRILRSFIMSDIRSLTIWDALFTGEISHEHFSML